MSRACRETAGREGGRSRLVLAVCSPRRYTAFVGKWCTVTTTDPDGRRHSLDVLADSSYDAAHLFVVNAKTEQNGGLPKPTLATMFEVVADGRVYYVAGAALQHWIVERRQKWGQRISVLSASGTGIVVNWSIQVVCAGIRNSTMTCRARFGNTLVAISTWAGSCEVELP